MKSENNVIFIFAFLIIAMATVFILPRFNDEGYDLGTQFFFAKNTKDLYAQSIESMFFARLDSAVMTQAAAAPSEFAAPEIPDAADMYEFVMSNKKSVIIYAQGDRFSGAVARSVAKTLEPYGYGIIIWDISGMDLTRQNADMKRNISQTLSALIELGNEAGVSYIIGLDIFKLSAYPDMRTVNAYYNDGYILSGASGIDLSYNIEKGVLENFGAYEYAVKAASHHELTSLLKGLLFEDAPFNALKNTMTAACELVIAEGGEITEEESALIAKGISLGILELE